MALDREDVFSGEKYQIVRECFILLGLISNHPDELVSRSDYDYCRGHIGPKTTPDSLARVIAPIYNVAKPTPEVATLRDQFAMAALTGLLAARRESDAGAMFQRFHPKDDAEYVYKIADSCVLEARKVKP